MASSDQSKTDHEPFFSPQKRWVALAVGLLAIIFIVAQATVFVPEMRALARDHDGNSVSLVAYRASLFHPNDITLDLRSISNEVRLVDLFRIVFRSAEALDFERFGQITFARSGTPVFTIDGASFEALGHSFASGENPVYMVRTLPSKLKLPNGKRAFEEEQGGWIYVLGKQMEHANSFAISWAKGETPN